MPAGGEDELTTQEALEFLTKELQRLNELEQRFNYVQQLLNKLHDEAMRDRMCGVEVAIFYEAAYMVFSRRLAEDFAKGEHLKPRKEEQNG